MKQIAIRASALTRQFSSVRALDGLTIEVPACVVFGFLGPNGAGKTTTIRLLLTWLQSPVGGMPCRWTTCFSIVPPQTGHRRHRTTVLSQHQNDQPHPVTGKVGCRR